MVELRCECLDVGPIRHYKKKRSKELSGTWKAFKKSYKCGLGDDFYVVRSVGFEALYVFVVLEDGQRKIRPIAVTKTPSAARIIQQLREATSFGDTLRFMHRDNDRLYGDEVPVFLTSSLIDGVENAFRSP